MALELGEPKRVCLERSIQTFVTLHRPSLHTACCTKVVAAPFFARLRLGAPAVYTQNGTYFVCIYLRCFACRFLLSFGGCSWRARRLPHGGTMTRTLRLPCSNRIYVHLFRCGIHAFGSELDWHAYEALCETTPHLRFPVPVRWLGRFFLYDRPPWPAAFIPR